MSLRAQLQSIYDERGTISPRVVLDVARAADHPLHDRFEWDDSIAGERYRLVQAGALIRSVKVQYSRADWSTDTVRTYHAVRGEEPSPTYMSVDDLAEDPVAREIVLRDMRREFQVFKRRYEHLAEFFDLLREAGGEASAA